MYVGTAKSPPEEMGVWAAVWRSTPRMPVGKPDWSPLAKPCEGRVLTSSVPSGSDELGGDCGIKLTAPTLIVPLVTLGRPRSSLAGAPLRMPLPMAGLPD